MALGQKPSWMPLIYCSTRWYRPAGNQVLDKRVLAAWCTGLIHPILEAGDPDDPGNYRGITVVVILAKLYAMVLDARASAWAEHWMLLTYNLLAQSCIGSVLERYQGSAELKGKQASGKIFAPQTRCFSFRP